PRRGGRRRQGRQRGGSGTLRRGRAGRGVGGVRPSGLPRVDRSHTRRHEFGRGALRDRMDPSHNEPALTTVFVDSKPSAKRIKRAKLVVVEGPDRGKEVTLERERVSVGRSIINDVILSDKAVSGSHFEIVAGESGHILRDLDSTNGTYCGDLRIKE